MNKRIGKIIVYGLDEPATANKESREGAEKKEIKEIAKLYHVKVDAANITKIDRLGTYEPIKKKPLLDDIDDIEICFRVLPS